LKYDAFISYRHGELDGLVAEKLHKMLETYRIPRAIARRVGKKKLARIFRDREELPTSSNLSDSINEALENSAFLLLICSRRTVASQWVMREVERFGELRGKDRIITLLIDGEPDESFPPGLRERELNGETVFVEPLAADIRAETPQRSIKLLKEEKLRLLAPILGCAFDDLRRRHRRRRMQRVATCVGAAFAFTLSFGAFSSWQYVQIDRQMQLKLENQSYVLSEYAAEELADGDPDTAALLALAALPADSENPERPFVPAAERALADALGVYDLRDGYRPHRALDLPAAPGKVMLSPGESRAAAVAPFSLTVFDTESGRILAELSTLRSALADAEFLSEDIVVFAGENGLEAHDVAAGESLWRGAEATSVAVSDDGERIAAVYGADGEAVVLDRDGRALSRISFGGRAMRVPADDSFLNPHDAIFELDADGGRLAVSFADGSLSVFDTASGAETPVHPASRATHFAGAFYEDLLAYALVEREPYASAYIVFDARAGERRAHFSSDASHFVPCAADDGLYVAFEDQVLSVDAASGDAKLLFSAGGDVETFGKSGDDFIVCESAGPYRFVGGDSVKVCSSDYTCRFADIGARFALTGSYDARTVRILKNADFGDADLLGYAEDYAFSEAKIHAASNRAAFYSHTGLRLCDLEGAVVAETAFPAPLSVIDTQYDETNGNIAVLYDDAFRLYSGRDASLILEEYGKKGLRSVVYADFGVSVLGADDGVTLYDPATGAATARMAADPKAERALPIGGGLLDVREGRVFFDGREIGAGDIIGAGDLGDGTRGFAVSDGAAGAVFSVADGASPRALFSFSTPGRAEAYFTGGLVFVSPLHGDASVYAPDGACVRVFAEKGYLAETGMLGDRIAASYIVAATSERYSLLLDAESSETVTVLPGFLGALDAETPVLDDGAGRLRAVKLRSLRELEEMARLRLDGRSLTPEETERFKAG
jgi:hypothetical protein